ncbi:MAG: hypothetical protein GY909_16080 [Oligoflexia bacterium]|nr:hypothetical protein [Oligoflexia bacterium]
MLLQYVGTEICREMIRDDFHLTKLDDFIAQNQDKNIVITDARFINEREKVKELGGTTVLVKRPNKEEISSSNHESEKQMSDENDFDKVIENDSTLDSFREKVTTLIKTI